MTTPTNLSDEAQAQRRAEFIAARNTYITIIVSFLTVCIVAVIITSRMEAQKADSPVFHPIQTTAPVSFFDKTYMHHKTQQHP